MTRSTVAANLDRLIKERHLSRRKASLLAGLNATAARDIIETTKARNPRIDTLARFANALGVTVDDLIRPDRSPRPANKATGSKPRRSTEA